MHNTISKSIFIAISCLLMATVVLQPALATPTANSEFPPQFIADETTFVRSGVGVLKYLGFIRIYNGALYLPENVGTDQALEDVAKRLEVKYLRSFKAEDFGPATIAGLKKNVDPVTYERLASRVAYHNSLYEDILPGDRVSLTYLPSIGTQVEINGRAKGTIEGADFAAALFSLWLGDKPFDSSFKRALLGGKG